MQEYKDIRKVGNYRNMKMRDVKKYEIREHRCVGGGGSALGGFGRPGMGDLGVGGEGL